MSENELEDVKTPVGITRRSFIKRAVTGAGIMLAGKLGLNAAPNSQELADSAKFMTGRPELQDKDVYIPPNPEEIISEIASDRIFDKLKLSERYPQTINKETFNVITQKPARLASLFFYPNKQKPIEEQQLIFELFCESFFEQMNTYSEAMKVDFIATLLMYQISGDATSSLKAQREDVLGDVASPLIYGALRRFEFGSYYSLPRLESAVSLGIHDIEIVMIARALKSLEQTLPDEWKQVADYLQKRSPKFFAQYSDYVDLYSNFEKHSDQIMAKISSSDIGTYLEKFHSPEKMKQLLLDGEDVDSYQLMRTTVFWAYISKIDQMVRLSGYVPDRKIIEKQALEKTLQYYLDSSSPTAFFLDQISNPKMISELTEDSREGNSVAKELLTTANEFALASDKVIAADRSIAGVLMEEKTEQDLKFQLITGNAYARWLLQDTIAYTQGEVPEKIEFSNPDELAFQVFLANGNRESAPTFQLAGSRPLNKATLTFGSPEHMFQTMQNFIDKVYSKVESMPPSQDFRTFSRYFLNLLEESYGRGIYGTSLYRLEGNKKIATFIKEAEKFGANQNIITPPHCSWMRSFEATVGYITEMAWVKETEES